MPKSKKYQLLDKLKAIRQTKKKKRDAAQQTNEFVINPDGTTTKVPKVDGEVKEI